LARVGSLTPPTVALLMSDKLKSFGMSRVELKF